MYEYISGILTEINPSYAVLETKDGVGWLINISLNTFSQLEGKKESKLFTTIVLNQREGTQSLYGFATKKEREIFLKLTSISGVGANTARVVLSSLSISEFETAVVNQDVKTIHKIKGIGEKTAQRIVIELKDKIQKTDNGLEVVATKSLNNLQREEAVSALVMLGYAKNQAEKGADLALKKNPSMSAEDIIKFALRNVK